jgi:hypothetical protein
VQYGPIGDAIVDIESRFPVSTWKIDGLHVWPLVRIRLYALLGQHAGGVERVEIAPGQPSGSRLSRVFRVVSRIATAPAAALASLRTAGRLGTPCDVFFYSLSHMRSQVDAVWHDRHCDPLIDILSAEHGLRSFLAESAYEVPHRTPRAHSGISVELDSWVRTTGWKPRFARTSSAASVDGYNQMLRSLAQQFPGIDLASMHLAVIQRDAARVIVLQRAFRAVLESARPRICFVVCYYHAPAMALAWACREAGIPCVELQHGMRANPAYRRWTNLPEAGYELLPEVFWNWTQSESDEIREWTARTNGAHRSLVGGFPWLDLFNRDVAGSPHSRDGVRILFSMPTFDYQLPEWVLAAVASSPAGWTWSFRLHPRQQRARDELKTLLGKRAGQTSWEIDSASDLPLPRVLQNTDVHVTHSSSVIIEAEYFGIRSVAIHPDSAKSYPSQMASGVLVIATDTADLLREIQSQVAQGRASFAGSSGIANTRAALETLLRGDTHSSQRSVR